MPARASSLPILQFCGRAPSLDVGAGRAAAVSTAFHALCSQEEGWEEKLARLTDEERDEVTALNKPEQLAFSHEGTGYVCNYEQADHEVEVAFSSELVPVTIDDPSALVTGHVDMAWSQGNMVVVGDIKKTRWTTLDGPNSLQLIAYGIACALEQGARYIMRAIWISEEERWVVGEVVDKFSLEFAAEAERVLAAARNEESEFSSGPHCGSCYSRRRCPAHMVELESDNEILYNVPGTKLEELDEDTALGLLVLVQQYKSTVKAAEDHLKAWAAEYGGICDGKGKVWKAVNNPGRKSLDMKGVLAEYPDAQQYMKQGRSYESFRWCNER